MWRAVGILSARRQEFSNQVDGLLKWTATSPKKVPCNDKGYVLPIFIVIFTPLLLFPRKGQEPSNFHSSPRGKRGNTSYSPLRGELLGSICQSSFIFSFILLGSHLRGNDKGVSTRLDCRVTKVA